MTVSLKMQIETAEKHYAQTMQRLKEQEEMIDELKSWRFECDHDFLPALKGYEHEGGHCKKCGINEVFWAHNKKS